jgi:HAD superfamily hydrolase (TIGR01509 family)
VSLEGVIFDVGGTLMWLQKRRFVRAGAWSLIHRFGEDGVLERARFHEAVRWIETRFATLSKEGEDYRQINTTPDLLEGLARAFDLPAGAISIEEQERIFNAPAVAGTAALPGMVELVRSLEGRVRLGIASNTRSHRFIAAAVAQLGLADSFDPLVTSVSSGIRKPGAGIFERVLDVWGLPPERVAMVGDFPHKDVAGARALGMRALWLTIDVSEQDRERDPRDADGVAATAAEALAILEGWIAG